MKKIFNICALVMGMALLAAVPAQAEDGASEATITEIKGQAFYLKTGEAEWLPLETGMVLGEGDKIKTGVDCEVVVETTGNAKTSSMTVRPETEFTFKTFRYDEASQIDNTLLDLEVGSILVKAEKLVGGSRFEVKTPTSIVGIRGTTFEVNVPK